MVYYFLSCLILLLSSPVWANKFFLKETKTGTKTERFYDINKDGKEDYIEVIQDKKLTEKKEDLNFDGIYDRQTTFFHESDAEYFKVILENKVGTTPRKQISYWHDSTKKKTFSLTKIDENNDGKWDREYKRASDMIQKRDICSQDTSGIGMINDFADDVLQSTARSDEYIQTSWGHKIHKSCLENDPDEWFLSHTENAIKQGLSCLEELGTKGGAGAARNFSSLDSLLRRENVQVLCNETGYDWGGGTIAHATTDATSTKVNGILNHPGISVNPASIREYKSQGESGALEFERTMFHEQLHNLGYLHNQDVEYPYACEKCCFPAADDSVASKEAACRICSGNYSSNTDIAYIKDITSYGKLTYSSGHAFSASMAHLKENPGSVTGMSYLALNLGDAFNPVGHHLAQQIKNQNNLSPEEASLIEAAEEYKDSSLLKTYDPTAKTIANAFYHSYMEGDPFKALQLLKKEMPNIKAQLVQNDPTSNSQYVKESLKEALEEIIYDVWLYEHTGKFKDEKSSKELNTLAYDVFNEFEKK